MTADLFNIEAEQQVLGLILTNNKALHLVSDILTPEHFYEPLHGEIFTICQSRIMADHLVSPVVLKSLMDGHEGLRELGGPSYLARIAGAALASYAAKDYAELIVDGWQRRTAIHALEDAAQAIKGGSVVGESLGGLDALYASLRVAEGQPVSISYSKAMTQALEKAVAAYQNDGSMGLPIGIAELDEMMGGLFAGDLIILGGAPSMGKTSLALTIAHRVADTGKGVAIVSLEMTGDSLALRAMSEVSEVAYSTLRRGKSTEAQFRQVVESAKTIINRPIEIIQPHVRDIGAIYAAAKRVQMEFERRGTPLALIILDYLQLVRAPGKDRYQQVTAISMGLKGLGMQLGVPVIALSQLSRDVQSRDDHRPKMNDLRESGQIEQDADFILFTHREHYYLQREGPAKGKDGKVKMDDLVDHEAAMRETEKMMEVICAKNRNGSIGTAKLGCDMATNRVWTLGQVQHAMEGL